MTGVSAYLQDVCVCLCRCHFAPEALYEDPADLRRNLFTTKDVNVDAILLGVKTWCAVRGDTGERS